MGAGAACRSKQTPPAAECGRGCVFVCDALRRSGALGRLDVLVIGLQRQGGVHQRRTAAHVDGHARHFHQFLAGGAQVQRGLAVKGDAAVAARGDGDAHGHQFLGLGVQRAFAAGGLGHGGKALHHVGNAAAQLTENAGQFLRQSGPIVGHGKAPRQCVGGLYKVYLIDCLAPLAKEIAQQGCAFALSQSAHHLGAVVTGGMVENAGAVFDAAALGVVGAEIHPAQPGQGNGGGAHGTGFQGDVEGGPGEPVVADTMAGIAQGADLGMGTGVMGGDGAIPALPQDLTLPNQDRPHRDLAHCRRPLRQGQGITHPAAIVPAGFLPHTAQRQWGG